MSTLSGQPVPFMIRGTYDAMDGAAAPDGACNIIQNLIHDISTPRVWLPRAAAIQKTSFGGFSSPGAVTAAFAVGTRIYGLVTTARNAGKDEPFVFDTLTNTFVSVQNVTAANTPTSQPTTGDWTPPMMDIVGSRVLVAHPGFNYGGGFAFGWFDISQFFLTFTANTNSNNVLTATSINPLNVGLQPGQNIDDGGVHFPSGTYIVSFTSTTITISQSAIDTTPGDSITVRGGSASVPLWGAGNTAANPLPALAIDVANFGNRAYYAVANMGWFSDVLKSGVISQATQFLTFGDTTPLVGFGGIPMQQTTGGILAALIAFKAAGGYYQITGDIALNNLALNGPIGNVGCSGARTIVQTPMGLWFMSVDGIRQIDFSGLLSRAPIKGVRYPFNLCQHPSRASAAFNNTVYRISLTSATSPSLPNIQHIEYWYDTEIDEWGGPHTCGQDIVVPMQGTFFFGSNDHIAALYQSDVEISPTTTYTEFGSALQVAVRTTTISKRGMSAKNVQEATIDLSQLASFGGVTLTLFDQNLGILATAITAPGPSGGAIWGVMVWGSFIWGGNPSFLNTFMVDWPFPVQFTLASVGIAAPAYGGLRIGTLWLRLEDLQFTTTQNPP